MMAVTSFKLPDIGEGVVEGEVVRWLVKEGDVVHEDQPMVEVMTDKATVEIPSPRAGRVAKLHVRRGADLPGRQGADRDRGERRGAPRRRAGCARRLAGGAGRRRASGDADARPVRAPRRRRRTRATRAVLATPATRKLARDLGVDIRAVHGDRPAGRVTSDDVQTPTRAARGRPRRGAEPRAALAAARTATCASRSAACARRSPSNLARSKHTAAHFTYVEEIDCTELVALRERAKAPRSPSAASS